MSYDITRTLEKAARKFVEAPKALIDEHIGGIGDALNDFTQVVSGDLDNLLSNTSKIVQDIGNRAVSNIKRPPETIARRAKNVGSKMMTERIE